MPRYIDAGRQERIHANCVFDTERDRQMAYDLIISAPPADVAEVRRGEWGQCSAFDEDENVYTCSVCGEPWQLIDGTPAENNMHFCPNCGADLR